MMRGHLVWLGLLTAIVACGEPPESSEDAEEPVGVTAPVSTAPTVSSTLSEDHSETTLTVESGSSDQVVSVGFGGLVAGDGDSRTVTVAVTPGAQEASFALEWGVESEFRLALSAPSGRVIGQESTDPDVRITEGSTSVTMVVAAPESGFWELRVSGADGAAWEQVKYRVTETGASLHADLFVDPEGEAGMPLLVVFGWSEPAGGIVDGEVVARVTDPAGIVRRFPLRDDGASGDSGGSDGVYGADVWATDLAGTYQVVVLASGSTAQGAPVQRQAVTEVTLGPKVDTDGDGVADDAEPFFGLDPADPSDGDTDHDGDGLGLATELAMGTNPGSWDTDEGGENDRSEVDRGLDPLDPSDDGAVESVRIGALPQDGNLIVISLETYGGTGSVQVYRFDMQTLDEDYEYDATDLGLHPGSEATFIDGPLPDGEYLYLAVAVAENGAESGPFYSGPVISAADVIPPDLRITLNGGRWDATTTRISVTFTDLTEPVPEMRLALSEEELANTDWIPFKGFTTMTIPDQAGQHFVYAQVRDHAGNESRVARAFVYYEPNS